ncbi:MAG: transglycosylase domain-containing protein [Candidatus Gracilibacteria bacterium]|nr:transglycosylase domain-containing protein [Candidatus Gracilibacteria bacterium]
MTGFKKEKLKISTLKKAYLEKKSKKKSSGKYIVLYAGLLIFFIGLFSVTVIAIYYLHDVPAISKIESDVLPESSVIYDRNGGELYNLYNEEKRTYVPYDQISGHMRNAIISAEDKTFFENPGIDFKGLLRAGFNYIIGKTDKVQGTSTISQQLIKNVFFTSERSTNRKVKEIYLSYALNNKYSKEKILELYLNKISFGNNAYGIEEAAKTYFNKSSKDVGVLGSSILASLPKGSSYYSPYSHKDRLMGYFSVHELDNSKDSIKLEMNEKDVQYKGLIEKFKEFFSGLEFKPLTQSKVSVCNVKQEYLKKSYFIDDYGCTTIDYNDLLAFLNTLKVEGQLTEKESVPVVEEKPVAVKNGVTAPKTTASTTEKSSSGTLSNGENKVMVLEYNTGRKDFVLGRMFEDGKITPIEYQNAFVGGLDFQFRAYQENIKYPHFVFYIKDYLENRYGKDFESQGGLRIYTTIDPVLQDKAEELVKKQVNINISKYGAKSAALVSMDNKTGQLLAMVGGADYFNTTEDGNVNIITSKRQPGSSFKPIVYTLAISKNPIGPDTPIFDLKTKFGDWEPNNYDEQFLGKMTVKKALDYSRNIPAIKMLYLAGGEGSVVEFAEALGITSLNKDGDYGATLAIGTGELKPIELMQAYSVFANGGYKKELSPILKITDQKGNLIEQYTQNSGKYVISDAAAYIISMILSDASSRPGDFWNNVLTLKDRVVAAKTGTSNKDVTKGKKKEILPRDLWTAGYTPQITTVVWAGNVDGSETKGNCDGLNCAAPIWHDFMEAAHKNLPKETFQKPESVITASISQISGRLASESTPDTLKVTSIFAVKPTEYEESFKTVEVDSLCNGKVTENTPTEAIKKGYLVNINPIIDGYEKDWLSSISGWIRSEVGTAYFAGTENILSEVSDEVCVRPNSALSNITVSASFKEGGTYPLAKYPFEIRYSSDNTIVRLEILKDGALFQKYSVGETDVSGIYKVPSINFGEDFRGEHTLTFRAIDKYGYSGTSTTKVTFEDKNPATIITIVSPLKESAITRIYGDQYFNLRFTLTPGQDALSSVNFYIDGKLSKILPTDTEQSIAINEEKDILIGTHTAEIETIDVKMRKTRKIFPFEVIAR